MQFAIISRQALALLSVLSFSCLLACGETTSTNPDEPGNASGESLVCGDGIVGLDEECDGGGAATADCDLDCTAVVCGDSVVNAAAGETCDDGNTTTEACDYGESSCTVCGPNCTEVSGEVLYCGNGTVEGTEECDDGNVNPGDGCRNNCTVEVCGDGIVDTSTTPSRNETCDDGNNVAGDGCSPTCRFE